MPYLRPQIQMKGVNDMNRISFASISVILAAVMIPQVLFWWLAPSDSAARLAVFVLGSVLTACIPIACFVTYWNCDIRRAGGVFVTGMTLDLIAILTGTLLLMFSATGRTAVFAYLIVFLASIGVMVPMIASALRTPWQGVGGNINEDMYEEDEDEDEDENEETCSADSAGTKLVNQAQKKLPARRQSPRPACRPLPARNR